MGAADMSTGGRATGVVETSMEGVGIVCGSECYLYTCSKSLYIQGSRLNVVIHLSFIYVTTLRLHRSVFSSNEDMGECLKTQNFDFLEQFERSTFIVSTYYLFLLHDFREM